MATRVNSKFLRNLFRQFTRPLSSTSSSSTLTSRLNRNTKPVKNREIIDLDDTHKLFSSISTTKLVKSSITLNMAAVDRIVDLGIWIMRSRLMEMPVFRDVIIEVVKHTFYEQFVAGKDLEETGRTVQKMWDVGVKGMLAYGLEHAHDNESCDQNFEAFLTTIESTKCFPPSSISFVNVKISAICPIELLERISDLLRWEKQHPTIHLPWKQNTLPLFSESSPLYHTLKKPQPLTPQEEQDLQSSHERLTKLCQRCLELNVPLTVDAEDTKIQPAIDYLTYNAAIEYNRLGSKSPMVFATIQAYLKDAQERMFLAMEAANKMGLPMGFKLVRGAYMSTESEVAASLGFQSPIHSSIQETHDCYNDCASFMLDKVMDGSGGAVVLATHNVESGKLLAKKARDMGIGKKNERLQFAQLYGMSKALSYGLNNAGFQVSKYLTFGPVEEVIPYLLRRAEENRGMLSSSNLDRKLIGKELKRRLMQGFRFFDDVQADQKVHIDCK